MKVEKISFKPTFKKENDIVVVSHEAIPLPEGFHRQGCDFVSIPPKVIAGNHRHPREEVFFCMDGGVELHWIDPDTQEKHVEDMGIKDSELHIFVIHSMIPHAVVNRNDTPITLIEFVNEPNHNVEPMAVVNS